MSFNFLAQHLSPSPGNLAKQQSQYELHFKVQKMVVNMKKKNLNILILIKVKEI